MFPEAMRAPLTAMTKQRLGDTIPALEQAYGSKEAMDRTVMQDAMFTEPARFQARHAPAHGSYIYQFAYVPENLRSTVTSAPHTGDIFFVFGNLHEMGGNMQDIGAPATAADRAAADLIGDYWADFMRTGNPNGG
jgi:para-nitrobenzyl esterase